ncbi:MAG: hypothetical protein ACO1PI_09060 [Bacteroidota bacterium]|jgi:hypothetical protein
MKLKRIALAVIAIIALQYAALGQLKRFEICNSSDSIKRVNFGDTVIIGCNGGAYLLNQNVLDNYRKSLQNNRSCAEIMKTYSALSNTQDSLIGEQNNRFNELKNKFDSLGNNTGQFLTITQGSLNQLSDTLGAVAVNLIETKQLLSDTKLLLEEQKNNQWKDRLKWGLGGFTVGVVATTVVFLIAR